MCLAVEAQKASGRRRVGVIVRVAATGPAAHPSDPGQHFVEVSFVSIPGPVIHPPALARPPGSTRTTLRDSRRHCMTHPASSTWRAVETRPHADYYYTRTVLVLELPRAGTDARSLDRTALLLCPAPFAASASWSLRKRLPRTETDPYLTCGCLFVERKHHYGLLVRSNLHVAIATRTQSIIGAHIDDSLLVRFTPLNA